MQFAEAVKRLEGELERLLEADEDEELQEAIEDIVAEYYGFDFGDDSRADDEEILLEDLAWAQVGSMALLSIATRWATGVPPGVRYRVGPDDRRNFRPEEELWRRFL